ncbi:hypothetical protein IW261DRAFT_1610614 [Armillaria novae-zelandiae]|uniref:C2H2-type domain-containing protein n=1 Tax=Armillaria novae-zelandiae TaxID=153914 RepID=A0AA39NYD8_9AGAR|nr:hypothetical protein IW261DRAFT_1610614 [Armillaria novae-zelandiae]
MPVIHPPSDLTGKPHACKKPCTKSFARRNDLVRHYKVHLTGDDRANKLIYCPFSECSSSDFQRSNIKAHIRAKHENHKHLVCLKCKHFWIATDLTALAEHGATVHGTVPLPQRQQREHYLTVGSQGINSTVAFLAASDSSASRHQRDAVVQHRFGGYNTKDNNFVDQRQFDGFSSHILPSCHLPSLSEVLRELCCRPIDEHSPPASLSVYRQQNVPLPGAEPPREFPQWMVTMPSPAVPTSDTRDYKVNFNADNVATRHSDSVVWRSSMTEERVASDYCRAGGLRWSLPPEFNEDR